MRSVQQTGTDESWGQNEEKMWRNNIISYEFFWICMTYSLIS